MKNEQAAICALDFVGVEAGRAREHLPPARRQTLAMLIAAGPAGLRVEAAADELWPTDLPDSWDASIRMAFSRLRKHIGADAVANDRGHCRLAVDEDRVDLWTVAALAADCRNHPIDHSPVDTEALRPPTAALVDVIDLISHEPFPGVETTPTILAAIARFEADRTTILHRLADTPDLCLDDHQIAHLQRLADRSPWDDDLQEQVAAVLTRSRSAAPARPPSSDTSSAIANADLPAPDTDLVGRCDLIAAALEAANASRGAVLTGTHGSGTSAVLDAVERELRRSSTTVVRLASLVASDVAFGAFLEQVATARKPVTTFLESDGPEASRLAACWIAVLDSFEQASHHVVFIVDRVEALDSHSVDLIGFLLRSKSTCAISVLVGADSTVVFEGKAVGWPRLTTLEVPPLSVSDIIDLLAQRNVQGTSTQLEQLAQDILGRTSGLAARASELVDLVDTETLTIPAPMITTSAPEWVVRRLDPAAATTATVAAMLGSQVTLDELSLITELDEPDLRAAVEQLLEHRVLVEHRLPDRYRLSDAFAQRVLFSFVDDAERRRLHLRLADHVSDPSRRAWHVDHARPLTSDHDSTEAHLAAARHHLTRHSYREAVASFRAAQQLTPGQLDAESLVGYAVALARVGIDNRSARRAAMQAASDIADEGLRLRAAMAGLPESEKLDGDPSRVDDLRSIDRTMLKPPDRVSHSAALSRELLLAGNPSDAIRWAHDASVEATNADERALAWLAREHIAGWTGSATTDAAVTDLDHINDTSLVTRILQATTISAIVQGNLLLADRLTEILTHTTQELGDPLRQWHAKLIASYLAEERLDFDEADRIADSALDLGFAHGLPLARSARMAQQLARQMAFPMLDGQPPTADSLGGSQQQLADLVGPVAEPGTSSLLARVARLRLQLAGVESVTDEVVDQCLQLLDEAIGSRFELRAIALVVPLISGLDRAADALDRCRQRIEPRRGTALVVGAGFSSSGPAELTLAELVQTDDERVSLFDEAIRLADEWQAARWQLLTRFRLHRHLTARTAAADHRSRCNELLTECEAVAAAAPTPLRIVERRDRLSLRRSTERRHN